MSIQYMTPGNGLPLVIETPMGLIDIRWDVTRPKKRLMISLPAGVSVHRGEERCMNELKFLRRREDGSLVPDYALLAPVVDDEGKIKGVKRPQRLALGRQR